MERLTVDSSVINSVGYDPEAQVLQIEFETGSIYEYYDVPEEVYEELINASSLGQFFNTHIRDTYQFKNLS